MIPTGHSVVPKACRFVACLSSLLFIATSVRAAAAPESPQPRGIELLRTLDAEGAFVSLAGHALFLTRGISKEGARPPGSWFDTARDPATPALVSSSLPPAWQIAVIGDRAVVCDYTNSLGIWRIAGREWHQAASLPMPGQTENIAVRSQLAFIANHTAGLTIVDFSKPDLPKILSNFNPKIDCDAVALWKDHAILYGHWESRLVVVDVRDPAQPRQTGMYQHTPKTFNQGEAEVDNGFIYCTANRALVIVDVADPANPKLAAEVPFSGPITDVWVQDGYAFLAGAGGVHVLDVSSPAKPAPAGFFPCAASQVAAQRTQAGAAKPGYFVYAANKTGPAQVLFFPVPDRPGAAEDGSPSPVLNYNCHTAIGLGESQASLVDGYGQVRSRHAQVLLPPLDAPLMPFVSERPRPEIKWRQRLDEGHLPAVRTSVSGPGIDLDWSAFASDTGGLAGDHVVFHRSGPGPVRLVFPGLFSAECVDGRIISQGRCWAWLPPGVQVRVRPARYNLCSPDSWSSAIPRFSPATAVKLTEGLAEAFSGSRQSYMARSIRYRIPATPGKPAHVYLGLLDPALAWEGNNPKKLPGYRILRLTVDGQTRQLDLAKMDARRPTVLAYQLTTKNGAIDVEVRPDPSSTHCYFETVISGIWVFDEPVKEEDLVRGVLDGRARCHIRCGQEPLDEVATLVEFELGSGPEQSLFLPYDPPLVAAAGKAPSATEARLEVGQRWRPWLASGAQFSLGVQPYDDLCRASLILLRLLRERHPGASAGGADLDVLKPGASVYNSFWMRDGSYMAVMLDRAGFHQEAETSMRHWWQPGITGELAPHAQQRAGFWQAPVTQWDGTGQAMWALVNHYELTRDRKWLESVYPSIRRAAQWLHSAADASRTFTANGEKPVTWGLLPVGEGEAITWGVNYYHDYWAVLGLRQALVAARALNALDDVQAFEATYAEFHADLKRSLEWAFEHTTARAYLPATPYNAHASIWGSMAALHPCRVLDPLDPMMEATLREFEERSTAENCVTYQKNHILPYLNGDLAMGHLLRDDRPRFHRYVDGLVEHASPTRGWIEGILLNERRGTGDMPHGWGAAQYLMLHRNSLVFENAGTLELGWGIKTPWLESGAEPKATGAPTAFGSVDVSFSLRDGVFHCAFARRAAGHPDPERIRLRLPADCASLRGVRFNDRDCAVSAKQTFLDFIP